MTDFESFEFKSRFTNNTNNAGTANVEIVVPLNYLSNFYRNLEMSLIICEIDLLLTGQQIVSFTKQIGKTFAITDTKLYVPVVTLST